MLTLLERNHFISLSEFTAWTEDEPCQKLFFYGQKVLIGTKTCSMLNRWLNNLRYITSNAVFLCSSEADPLVGWSKDEEWRADSTYAAMVAKVYTHLQIPGRAVCSR